jgi:hypothetical protein
LSAHSVQASAAVWSWLKLVNSRLFFMNTVNVFERMYRMYCQQWR